MKDRKDFTEIISIIIIAAILALPIIGATLITIAAVQEWGFVGLLGKTNLLKVALLWKDYVIARVGYGLIFVSIFITTIFKTRK